MIASINKGSSCLSEDIFCHFFLRAHLWFIQLGREFSVVGILTPTLSQIVFEKSTEDYQVDMDIASYVVVAQWSLREIVVTSEICATMLNWIDLCGGNGSGD